MCAGHMEHVWLFGCDDFARRARATGFECADVLDELRDALPLAVLHALRLDGSPQLLDLPTRGMQLICRPSRPAYSA